MGTAQDLLVWARRQLDVTESPPNSNHVRYWDDCGQSSLQGNPWCAAFVLAGLMAVDVDPISRSPLCFAVQDGYAAKGRWFPIEQAQPGDQIIYGIGKGHTGIVVSVDLDQRQVTAIEGNTSSTVQGSQDNGGGVYRRVRSFSVVRGVGRPPFDPPIAAAQAPTEIDQEEDMAMTAPVPGLPVDTLNRVQHWTCDRDGNIQAWNGAPDLKSLNQLTPTHPPIVAIHALPDGTGVMLIGDDGRHEGPDGPKGEWVQSTYIIKTGM